MDSGNSSTTEFLCVKGCGFYGASENRNMCSKCYLDFIKNDMTANSRSAETQKSESMEKAITAEIEEKSESIIEEGGSSKNRCENCNKKVGLTGFKCRCGKLLCGMHRYPQEHSCDFDFKDSDRRVLAKQNVIVKGDKMDDRI
ncbi:zinc finger A20 and AN1 domain-containing stress-associated protein 1-like [Euphorbia lathyris]|uniref:zinc finger A20 and AN1 domain-containing stress-associated protein 1-like n=1 Tax=Euphorbia lathyris TaxID=212925 RepID=UPI0033142197